MRLIDADALIEKFNEKASIRDIVSDEKTAERFVTFYVLADAVKQIPTVDAVPVIRCKDCKFRYWDDFLERYCCEYFVEGVEALPNDFCSYAEKKEENDERMD